MVRHAHDKSQAPYFKILTAKSGSRVLQVARVKYHSPLISVLCVARRSNYRQIDGLDLWDASRDAYNFTGSNPVIVHPPCQQWSKLRQFARIDERSKALAWFCLEKVKANGGIFEHPSGSDFFKAAGIKPTISIDQNWFGFPARKRTYLYFHGYKPIAHPLTFTYATRTVESMGQEARSIMPLQFCQWLVDCLK